ncbi:MAG TPA: AAA domain-containing protein [Kiritimatiellia bacterium]|jgi:very-short-patch-repair endonuclease|nr:DUF559 domain-containing protein [Kiritimatiellia bacterium]HQF20224.1 AAA domain-containing protein [Kiritimatiellia bacterium]HQG74783.1 AAA domain-containing protein [Kiritimatiellia bacterium]HXK78753.1 AAA domain-containing protein [Kiritimatiellia bacterium]
MTPISDGPTKEIGAQALLLLRNNPGGLTSLQLSRLLKGHPPAYQVALALQTLQTAKVVRLINGVRWRCVGEYPARQERLVSIAAEAEGSAAGETRWEPFRKLCRYYADCARVEAGAHIEAFADKENKSFVSIGSSINWDALSSGESVFLDALRLPGPLLARLCAANAPPVYLGGPVQIWIRGSRAMGESFRFVSPLFLIPVKVRLSGHDTACLEPLGHAEINTKWLEDFFRKPTDKREFLEQCGLAVPWASMAESAAPVSPPSLPDLFRMAAMLLPKKWMEPPCIYQPNDGPALNELGRPGIYNRLILAPESSTSFTARLRRELIQISKASDQDLDQTALTALFPHRSGNPTGQSEVVATNAPDVNAEIDLLNEEQRLACDRSRQATLSVVTGPPGTGKSRVVANAMVRAALNNGSVLFASRNHQALDAVEPKMNELARTKVCPVRLNRPYGETQDNPFFDALKILLTNQVPAAESAEYGRKLAELRIKNDEIAEMRAQLATLRQQFLELEKCEKDLAAACWEHPLREALFRNAPKTPAMDSMDPLLASLVGLKEERGGRWAKISLWVRRWVVLRAKRSQLRALIVEGFRLIEGKSPGPSELNQMVTPSQFTQLVKMLEGWLPVAQGVRLGRRVAELQGKLRALQRIEDLEATLVNKRNDTQKSAKALLKAKNCILGAELEPIERHQLDTVWSIVRNYQNTPDHPGMLRALKPLRKHFPLLLQHIPLWATTNLSVGRSIPLAPALFGLLIVDEASQCDIASAIPLLYRAKRAMVVGDPMQLTFVASLGADADYRLRQKHGVLDVEPFERYSYRTKSLYGLAATSAELPKDGLVMLREHFRCDEGIADYFNEAFYRDRLIVLTDKDRLKQPAGSRLGILWTQVDADARAAPSGGAISEAQIQAIVSELQKLKSNSFKGTVGVVTPFRAQANRIRDQAQKMDLPERWDFKSDTADGFQGGERDVILFSLVGGPDMPAGAEWFYQSDPNRFNVAISRARSVLHVFGDKEWARSWAAGNAARKHIASLVAAHEKERPEEFDLAAYLQAEPRPDHPKIIGDPALIGPVWEQKFADALWGRGLRVVQQYPACGRVLDIALIREGLKLDIEVDGECHRDWDGGHKSDDLRRDITLIANGWKVLRFWTYELRENFEGCVDRVMKTWQA